MSNRRADLADLAADTRERLRRRAEDELTTEHGCRPFRPLLEARMHELAVLEGLVDHPALVMVRTDA